MPVNVEFFDAMLRGGATLSLLLTAGIVLNSGAARGRKIAIVALAAGLIIYLVISSNQLSVDQIFIYPPALNPFLIWWVGVALFWDDFQPRFYHLPLAALMVVHIAIPALTPVRAIAAIALYAHLLYIAISSRNGDLSEVRLIFRNWFLGATALTGVIIGVVEVRYQDAPPDLLLPMQAASLCLLTTLFLIWLSKGGVALLTPASPPLSPTRPSSGWDDPAAVALVEKAMAEGAWRREGLTVAQLASDLNLPERRLRRAINVGLGFRNFSAFTNSHRITAAQTALANPDQAGETILTIAYDCGFASLGPFNRAFRAATGQSPTEYRRKALSDFG